MDLNDLPPMLTTTNGRYILPAAMLLLDLDILLEFRNQFPQIPCPCCHGAAWHECDADDPRAVFSILRPPQDWPENPYGDPGIATFRKCEGCDTEGIVEAPSMN